MMMAIVPETAGGASRRFFFLAILLRIGLGEGLERGGS
jgi:hypothetical protein